MAFLLIVVFLVLTICILTHSALSLSYALLGLSLWFDKMIPTLLPFMILSGIMIRMHLTEGFTTLLYPIIRPVFRVSENVCYGMIIGFLCGFPMGAKTVADLLEHGLISKEEARFLLAFCNNIGPVYFCSFVLPLLGRQKILPYVFGMYGLPLLYGLGLRYTLFRKLPVNDSPMHAKNRSEAASLLTALDESIGSSIQSITKLGGYMILCNLLNLLPHLLLGKTSFFLAPLLEITGGLSMAKSTHPLYSLLVLPFGGISCIAQTHSCIANTSLSLLEYSLHKVILTIITGSFYLGWFLLSPASFLC